MRISFYAVLLITNVVPFAYSLRCGYGSLVTGLIPTVDPREMGFEQQQCNNDVHFCVTYTTLPFDTKYQKGITVEEKFCDGTPQEPTCQSVFNGKAGCTHYEVNLSQLRTALSPTVGSHLCCCNTDLCNCDQTSTTSTDYCTAATVTTQKPAIAITSNASSLNKIISSFLAVFIYFAVR